MYIIYVYNFIDAMSSISRVHLIYLKKILARSISEGAVARQGKLFSQVTGIPF